MWRGYWKPKHHLGDHLKDALEDHGAWRAYWCMWGESFLQYLKRLFEMGNNKSAPYSVAIVWAAKAKQRYREPSRHVWYHDTVDPMLDDADFQDPSSLPMSIPMHTGISADAPLAVRQLRSFTRSRVHVSVNAWVLVTDRGVTVIGRCNELLQLHVMRDGYIVSSVVRMLLVDVVQPVFDQSGFVTLSIDASKGQCMCIQLETAQLGVFGSIL